MSDTTRRHITSIWGLVALVVVVGLLAPPAPTAQTTRVANNAASLAGKTILTAEDPQTISGQLTFSRGANAPFGVNSGAGTVPNLDADKLDGQHGSYYQTSTNQTAGTLPLARFGALVPSALTPLTWGNTGTANTLGNGTLTGQSLRAGNLVLFEATLQWGSTTASGSGIWSLTLPVAGSQLFAFDTVMYDSSAGIFYRGTAVGASSTTLLLEAVNSAAPAQLTGVSTTAPFTWATGDYVFIRGWYFSS